MSIFNIEKAYIPLGWYVGIRSGWKNESDVGFMTPDGSNKAAEARKETVRHWSTIRGENNIKSIEAIPHSNFKIAGYSSRHQGNKVIQILDPNEYILEIPVYNLMYIMENSTISHNKIQCECQWIRNGGTNLLVPTHTSEFTQIATNKRR